MFYLLYYRTCRWREIIPSDYYRRSDNKWMGSKLYVLFVVLQDMSMERDNSQRLLQEVRQQMDGIKASLEDMKGQVRDVKVTYFIVV